MIFNKLFKKDKNTSQEQPSSESIQSSKVDYYAEGVSQFDAGNYTQAMEFFQAAIAERPQSAHPYLKLAESYKALGKDKEAISTLYRLLASDPSNDSAQKMLQTLQRPSKPEQNLSFDIDDEFERIIKQSLLQDNKEPRFSVVDSEENKGASPRVYYGSHEPYDPQLDLKDYIMPNADLFNNSDDFKGLLTAEEFVNSSAALPIIIGKDDQGKAIVEDLSELPHLLVAGMTNYGVPTFLNGMLLSLLMKKHPADLKLVLAGDVRLELSSWGELERHFLTALPDADNALVLDGKKFNKTINSIGIELSSRYDLLKLAGVRTIKDYNGKFCQRLLNPVNGHRYLPYIVVVLFESCGFFDKETLPVACKLLQLGKTVGIHMVVSTQQMGAAVVDPQIRSNISTGIAFKVSRMAESNAILGESGAQYLKKIGEALYKSNIGTTTHIESSPIADEDIDSVIRFISDQRGYPDCYTLPEYLDEEEKQVLFDPGQKDEFFNDAARLVVASQFGSSSLIQRKLQLGYNRAGRIIDQLEAAGILGPSNGSKARDVLIRDNEQLEDYLRKL